MFTLLITEVAAAVSKRINVVNSKNIIPLVTVKYRRKKLKILILYNRYNKFENYIFLLQYFLMQRDYFDQSNFKLNGKV